MSELRILDRSEWPSNPPAVLTDIEGPVYLVAGHEMNGEAVFIPVCGPVDPAEVLEMAARLIDVLPKDGEVTP